MSLKTVDSQNTMDDAIPLRLKHIGEAKRRKLVFTLERHPAAEAHAEMGTVPPCSFCGVSVTGECVVIRKEGDEQYVIACRDCARDIGEAAR
jgi:hypothetical protein